MKSVTETVGRGVAWNTTGIMVGKALIVLNVLLILSHLRVYDYGLTELVMSAVSMAGLFMLSGLTSIVTADLGVERARQDLGRMKSIFIQFLTLNMVLGVLIWAVFFFGSTYVAELVGNVVIGPFLQIVSFMFLISPFRTITIMLANVNLRYADQASYGVVEEVWKFILLVILLVQLGMGARGLLIAVVCSQALTVVSFSWRTRSAYRLFAHAQSVDPSAFWKIFHGHRLWGIGVSYTSTVSQNLRIWIIKLMLGTEAVGLFAFAYGLYGNLLGLLPLSSVLTPLYPLYVHERDRLTRIIRISMKGQLILSLALCIGAMATAPLFVKILFPQFVSAIPLLLLLLLGLLPSSILTVITPVFAAFKEQRSLFFGAVVKALLMLVFIFPAILLFGVLGLAVELVLTTLGSVIERYWRLRRFIPELNTPGDSFFTVNEAERVILKQVLQRPTLSRVRTLFSGIK